MRFVIYTDGHLPAHIHVIGDGELKIHLQHPEEVPLLVRAVNWKASHQTPAMYEVKGRREFLLQAWRDIRGGD
jgi:hypothetical protein|tara:strand:- start:9105 stop:9323 length:219 start_codon:yes stop_codon:yes gene_type:complete